MSIVVNLSDYRRRSSAAAAPPGAGATIHLFLGVRYERHEDTPGLNDRPARKSPGSRGGKRRRA